MSSETITRETVAPQKVTEKATPDETHLGQVIQNVRRDSRDQAGEYLNESTVPHGGE